MQRVAVFVDAGYLWVQLSHIVHGKITGRDKVIIDYPRMRDGLLAQVSAQFPNINLLRVYWYDGPGQHGKTPGHCAIEELDDIKLRLGTRNGVGDQKAVDGLIIADMIALAQSKAITDALLISGDADLTPGVAASQNLGIRVHLLTMGLSNATSPFLRCEVDVKAHWDDIEVKKFASAIVAPNGVQHIPPNPPTPAIQSTAVATNVAAPIAWMDEVATQVLTILTPAQIALIPKHGGLPKDVDQILLREGCKKSGLKSLEEDQKRQLRTKLRSQKNSAPKKTQ